MNESWNFGFSHNENILEVWSELAVILLVDFRINGKDFDRNLVVRV